MASWDSVVDRYVAGEPLKSIAADTGISPSLVIHRARKAGIGRRRVARAKEKPCDLCGVVFAPPQQNRGRRYCSPACRAAGSGAAISAAKRANTAPVTTWGNGYRFAHVPADHVSRTSTRRLRTGRAPEHVLIAETVLGRPLLPSECVHHINGDKADNRNANLLVCTRSYHNALHARMSERYQREKFGRAP